MQSNPTSNLQAKAFVIIAAAAVFLFGFQWSISTAWDVFFGETKFADGATIGGTPVAGHTRESAVQVLSEQIEGWRSQDRVQLFFESKEITMSSASIAFDIPSSVKLANLEGSSPLHILLNQDDLSYYIDSLLDPDRSEALDRSALTQAINDLVGQLPQGLTKVNLSEYITLTVNTEVQTIADVKFVMAREDTLLAEWLSGSKEWIIPPQERTSLLHLLEEQNINAISSTSLDLIASAFYQAVLQTNFEVVERHIGRELPLNVQLGAEAKIVPGKSDFVFLNPNATDYKIELKYGSGLLHLILSGVPLPYQYRIVKEEQRSFLPKTIIHYNPKLSPDASIVKEEGSQGSYVKIYRETFKNQLPVSKELVSEDFYPPINRVVERNINDLPINIEQSGLSSTDRDNQDNGSLFESAEEAPTSHSDVSLMLTEIENEYTDHHVIVLK